MTVKIIAEIGINHNGDMDTCKKLMKVASEAGCDAVKFQKRNINKVYTKEFLDGFRDSPWGKTQRDQKIGLEFDKKEYDQIDNFARELNIDWFASAWDEDSLVFLKQYNCKYNKIASAMIIEKNFLENVANEKKYTFISTGMSSMDDIKLAVKIFKDKGCPFELMHTVSTYPMSDKDANLKCIPMLKNTFGCDVGYSGHESGLAISYAAIALGATSLERHITLNRTMYGSDQAASIEPNGLRQLVGAVRKIEISLGDGIKRIIPAEVPIAKKLREHLV